MSYFNVTFNEKILFNADVYDTANYSFTPAISITSITKVTDYILKLNISSFSYDTDYLLTIQNVTDIYGTVLSPINPIVNTAYTPFILWDAETININTVRLTFLGSFANIASNKVVGKYTITGPTAITVSGVTYVDATTVDLAITGMNSVGAYIVQLTNIISVNNHLIDDSYSFKAFYGIGITRNSILFGGFDGVIKSDTWEYNGLTNTWFDASPVGVAGVDYPVARYLQDMTYMSVQNKILLFGGTNGGYLKDTWEWDCTGKTWTKYTPVPFPNTPDGTYSNRVVYDVLRDKVLFFGGIANGVRRNMTWEWDSTAKTWTDVTPLGLKPSARIYFAMSYDLSTGKVVVFGGDDNGTDGETWEWDGATATWANVSPGGVPGVDFPAARQKAVMAYDTLNSRSILFGGQIGGMYKQDTWSWNSTTKLWTDVSPAGISGVDFPTVRALSSMAYDIVINKIILFGGTSTVWYMNDTWRWDGVAKTWTEVTPVGLKPSARMYQGMA